MVNIALGTTPLSACTAGDADHSGDITIDEMIAAVNNALNGCVGRMSPARWRKTSGVSCATPHMQRRKADGPREGG